MDGDPVTGEPSDTITYTDIFMKLCPQYMAMGMTYDEFWHGPSILVKFYREAFEMRRHEEEWARHRMGAYVYDALLRVAPVLRAFTKGKVEPGKYPEEPWPLTEKEARQRQERDRIAAYNRMKEKLFSEAKRDRERLAAEAETKEANEVGRD